LRVALIKQALVKKDAGNNIKIKAVKKMDSLISLCKQNLLSPDDDLKKIVSQEDIGDFKKTYHEYQSFCKEQNVADFEDLIMMVVNMLIDDKDVLSEVRGKYLYIFIDEYQDLNFGQYELVKLLYNSNHIVVIGDPDQSIYGFRGSDNRYFKRFADDFPDCEKIVLNKNYRSTQTILDASFQMIEKKIKTREELTKKRSNKEESTKEISKKKRFDQKVSKVYSDIKNIKKLIIKETATEYAEAVAIGKMIEKLVGGTSFFSMDAGKIDLGEQKEYAFSDFAILYRTSRQGETFVKVFEQEGIPFQVADKKDIYDVDGIKQCLSICRIISKSASFLDFEIVADYFGQKVSKKESKDLCDDKIAGLYNEIKEYDNKTSIIKICEKTGLKKIIEKEDKAKQIFEKFLSIAGLHNDLKSFIDAIALNKDADTIEYDVQKVSLLTMHAAKGLEFPVVFVAGCEQGLVPFARDGKNIDDLEEERRLFYVAMTRAMDILCLSHAKKRSIYGVRKTRERSFFIDDIEKELTQVVKSRVYIKPVKKAKQMEMFK